MKKSKFRLNNPLEIEKFDENIIKYFDDKLGFSINHFDLKKWFSLCEKDKKNGGKLFSAVLDLKLTFTITQINYFNSRKIWSTHFANRECITKSILDNYDDFENCLSLMNYINSFIFNYRATWDKIMGLIIMQNIPDKYDKYRRAKSRKSEFVKICDKKKLNHYYDINSICDLLDDFDRQYRTPEAHATGSLRNWVLNPNENLSFNFENPNYELTGYWNELVSVVNRFNDI